MKLVLPPGVSAAVFDRAMKAFERALGSDAVFATDLDRGTYADKFAIDEMRHHASAALAPASSTEVQAIVRIANEFKIALWPISRGKNLGFGHAAPLLSGSVIVDLSRMKRIEFFADSAMVSLEPGVGFYDLYDYIQSNRLPFWISVPGNAWGSVLGNALERGEGYTPYGNHVTKLCGMEVVLPDGSLLRTGMGAMASGSTWGLYQNGFGPGWDGMFAQSNFGIVTRANLWLMPAPEQVVGLDVEMDRLEDLAPLVDVISALRREGLLQHMAQVGNALRAPAIVGTRDRWIRPGEPITDEVIAAVRKEFGLGWWGTRLRIYGRESVTKATLSVVESAIRSIRPMKTEPFLWRKGEPIPPGQGTLMGVPQTLPMQTSNWFGGRGGLVFLASVLPQSGKLALEHFRRAWDIYRKFGMDLNTGFIVGERHVVNPHLVLFDKDDPAFMKRVDPFMRAMIANAREQGYGEYRAHIDYMDSVASAYDYNDHAQRRLNERLKNMLDPNGILAPGKNGIWPAAYAGERRS